MIHVDPPFGDGESVFNKNERTAFALVILVAGVILVSFGIGGLFGWPWGCLVGAVCCVGWTGELLLRS